MNIRDTRELTALAARRLSEAPARKRIVLIYAGLLTGLAVLTTLLSFLLGLQINRSGGLSNMGTRTILSALQTMLNPIQIVLTLCLSLITGQPCSGWHGGSMSPPKPCVWALIGSGCCCAAPFCRG